MPWVGYNLSRFEHPVLLSSQFEPTLVGSNCADTYQGPQLGYITLTCLEGLNIFADQSVTAEKFRERTLDYVGDHLDRVPIVVAARLGRITGTYRVSQQLNFESYIEGRERWVAITGLGGFYVMATGAIVGAVVLRRRRKVPVFPLLVAPAIVVITVAITYGSTRFRAVAETSLVVLTAVVIDAVLTRRRGAPARP
jgi:hypothetical protein